MVELTAAFLRDIRAIPSQMPGLTQVAGPRFRDQIGISLLLDNQDTALLELISSTYLVHCNFVLPCLRLFFHLLSRHPLVCRDALLTQAEIQ